MARMILRASIDGPYPNTVMRDFGNLLKAEDFERIGTGAYEGDQPTSGEMLRILKRVVEYFDGLPDEFTLDHLWVYADDTSSVESEVEQADVPPSD